MFQWIKRELCDHNFKIIEEVGWIIPGGILFSDTAYKEQRKYIVCLKCGHKIKISKY